MIITNEYMVIALLALATYFCRAIGFYIMRHIPFTPAVRRGLEALPGSVVMAICVPGAIAAGLPGLLGVAASLAAMLVFRRDVIAMVLGCAAVAAARQLGF